MGIKEFKEREEILGKMSLGLIKEVEDWLERHHISNATIERDKVEGDVVFYIDVDGDVLLEGYHLNDVYKIPYYIKFRNVSGKFILTND